MSHLLPTECWDADDPPRTLAYFCNTLPCPPLEERDLGDADYPRRWHQAVRENSIRFLEQDVNALWPQAADQKGFRWSLLAVPEGHDIHEGSHPVDSQYYRANVSPTDRYVLALPGTLKYRISPLDATYDNLTLAGDWTDCGFNVGCVEAAVMSGRLASHALSRYPALEDIDGYDHP